MSPFEGVFDDFWEQIQTTLKNARNTVNKGIIKIGRLVGTIEYSAKLPSVHVPHRFLHVFKNGQHFRRGEGVDGNASFVAILQDGGFEVRQIFGSVVPSYVLKLAPQILFTAILIRRRLGVALSVRDAEITGGVTHVVWIH